MKLATLKKRAQLTTSVRGHRMKWGEPFGNATTQVFVQHGQCRKCGAHVFLDTHPALGISGLAVSVNCEKKDSVN